MAGQWDWNDIFTIYEVNVHRLMYQHTINMVSDNSHKYILWEKIMNKILEKIYYTCIEWNKYNDLLWNLKMKSSSYHLRY